MSKTLSISTKRIANCCIPGRDGRFTVELANGAIASCAPCECENGAFDVDDSGDGATINAGGAFLIGGLWDEHAHVDLASEELTRIDLRHTTEPEQVLDIIGEYVKGLQDGSAQPQIKGAGTDGLPVIIQASGFRVSGWSSMKNVADLDAVSGDYPVLMISGDAHCGWVNTAAQKLLTDKHYDEIIREHEWFDLMSHFKELPDADQRQQQAMEQFIESCAPMGVIGIRDMSVSDPAWGRWSTDLTSRLYVELAAYPGRFEEVIAAGRTTGDRLPDVDPSLDIVQGPLKIISDGSLGTRTAYCCRAYDDGTHGIQNLTPEDLRHYLTLASDNNFEIAIHAIGDCAMEELISAVEKLSAEGKKLHGSIEHVQLLGEGQAKRMAKLGLGSSIQPAHLLDDYPLAQKIWPKDMDRCYCFKDMYDAGSPLLMGSDAPVAKLDPWLAMAAAVYRGPLEGADWEWQPSQRLTVKQALDGSTRHHDLSAGSAADLVLIDRDPFMGTDGEVNGREYAENLMATQVVATLRKGTLIYSR